ncbi:hypothetical protein PVAP13_2NG124300 [Panicum virgatum]|uniref:Uncharacterized protein n=1 Tax=Panicum virgatum TaxID=38727 RepID=A0A8T0VE98_PANVG|nr:hypothetical protein PVAP13_2NG124300 [Panicum virgatum]
MASSLLHAASIQPHFPPRAAATPRPLTRCRSSASQPLRRCSNPAAGGPDASLSQPRTPHLLPRMAPRRLRAASTKPALSPVASRALAGRRCRAGSSAGSAATGRHPRWRAPRPAMQVPCSPSPL